MIIEELINYAQENYEKGKSFPRYIALSVEKAREFTKVTGIKINQWPIYTIYRTNYGELLLSVGCDYES